MAVVEEELKGAGKVRQSRVALAKSNLDRHIQEKNFRQKNDKVIVPIETLNKIKENKMAGKEPIITDDDLLVLLKYCKFNNNYIANNTNFDPQAYPAIGVLAYYRKLIKGDVSRPLSLQGVLAERVRDFYNINKGHVRTPKPEEALGYVNRQNRPKKYAPKPEKQPQPFLEEWDNKPPAMKQEIREKQEATQSGFTTLVAVDSKEMLSMIFEVGGKSADYTQGVKDAVLRLYPNVKFIEGNWAE